MEGAREDFYRKWAVTIGADNTVRIQHVGSVVTNTAEGWINLAKGMLPESRHVAEMMNAIHWHFGPADAQKVMERYLRQINKAPDESEEA